MVRRRRLKLHSPGPTVPLLRAAAGPLSLWEIIREFSCILGAEPRQGTIHLAGLAGLAVVFGVTTEQWSMIGNAVAAVSAAIAMFVSEANAK